jgi:hypothetical protein
MKLLERADDRFEAFLLLAEVLRALLVAPDFRVFGELLDFGQAQFLGIEVKDTSAARRLGFRRLPTAWR